MEKHTPAPTPHRAVYGFVFFLVVFSLFIIYILWAIIPSRLLDDQLYIHYLPDKYFVILIPIFFLCAFTFFVLIVYPAINFSLTAKVDEVSSIREIFNTYRCKQAGINGKAYEINSINNGQWNDLNVSSYLVNKRIKKVLLTPTLRDIDVGYINKLLYNL